ISQDSVKETLINAIQNNKIVNAYLLTGPRGSGKTSTARIIAKSLNCLNPSSGSSPTIDPCGKCETCLGVINSSSVDVTEIDAASHGGVSDARDLIEKVNMASITGKYRIYIIDEVHMLSTEAFNALLKVIEEPPAKVIFVLATTEEAKVPKTISSRCQNLKFKPITVNATMQRLKYVSEQEAINIDTEALTMIAEHSDGAMRDALGLLDQLSVFSNTETTIGEAKVLDILGLIPGDQLDSITAAIITRDPQKLVEDLNTLLANGKDPMAITNELSGHILNLVENLIKAEPSPKFTKLIALVKESSTESFELVQILDSLNGLSLSFKNSTQTKNVLKAWLIKITHRADILVVKDLLTRIEKLEQGTGNKGTGQARANPAPKPTQSVPITKPQAKPIVEKAASPTEAPQAAPVQAAAPKTESQSDSFLEHLSPGSRGMYISSQAKLIKVEGAIAQMQMPDKFKFLKAKLESRSAEILEAIVKSSGQTVQSLNIEVVEVVNQTASNP
ncbi:MAG: DNA polymerase III subunit gamma/tau, partial [Candidatus Melainabacteria bacterium]|nr:DNA polymerase III subunit gamma/tau [Candidatus Melainabacteria bacterium]